MNNQVLDGPSFGMGDGHNNGVLINSDHSRAEEISKTTLALPEHLSPQDISYGCNQGYITDLNFWPVLKTRPTACSRPIPFLFAAGGMGLSVHHKDEM
eukprot:7112898-Ditylum_brightwellii.AAC.1